MSLQSSCGREGTIQVVHSDRLRRAKSQVLTGEDTGEVSVQDRSRNELMDTENDDPEHEIDIGKEKRVRRKPDWMKDYILSISRHNMAKTKNTPRKQNNPGFICGSCKDTFSNRNDFKYHILTCMIKEFGCEICKKTFNKQFFYDLHMKKKHGAEDKTSAKMDCKEKIVQEKDPNEVGDKEEMCAEKKEASDSESQDSVESISDNISNWSDPDVEICEEESAHSDIITMECTGQKKKENKLEVVANDEQKKTTVFSKDDSDQCVDKAEKDSCEQMISVTCKENKN